MPRCLCGRPMTVGGPYPGSCRERGAPRTGAAPRPSTLAEGMNSEVSPVSQEPCARSRTRTPRGSCTCPPPASAGCKVRVGDVAILATGGPEACKHLSCSTKHQQPLWGTDERPTSPKFELRGWERLRRAGGRGARGPRELAERTRQPGMKKTPGHKGAQADPAAAPRRTIPLLLVSGD